jgi:hypothetical protein
LLFFICPNGRWRLFLWIIVLNSLSVPSCGYPSEVKEMRLRIPHMRTVAEIVGAVLLPSAGAASAAAIIPSATSTTIHGCENAKTGALSVQLAKSCPGGTKPISWNVTGPAGPPGTTGIFGTSTNTAKAATGSGGAQCTVGEVILTAGTTTAPGILPADGQLLPIAQNAVLFALFGTKYGGNGKTTFGIPNLKKAAPNGLSYGICEYNAVYP